MILSPPQRGDFAPKEAPLIQIDIWLATSSFHLPIKRLSFLQPVQFITVWWARYTQLLRWYKVCAEGNPCLGMCLSREIAQTENWWQPWSGHTVCGHTVEDLTNLHNVGFIAFSCLFSSGLGAALPEMQRCVAKPGRGRGKKEESSRGGDWRKEIPVWILISKHKQFLRLS